MSNQNLQNKQTVRQNERLEESYTCVQHKSGLTIYVFPKKLSTYYALFGTKYGSIDTKFRMEGESDYATVTDGIAHFLEHKMFENESGEDTFLRFARTGADANAYTSFDRTAYLFSCTDHFTESLEILLDYVTHPYFTPETVQKEQGIIGQEIKMCEDTPSDRLLFNLLKCLYEKHSVRREIAGTVESISVITADLLYRCYRTFYNLHNMVLCVAGDVTAEEVTAVADRILPVQEKVAFESITEAESPSAFRKRAETKMEVATPMFEIGFKDTAIPKDPKERMRRGAALSVVGELLFGAGGELFNELYASGKLLGSFRYGGELNASYSFFLCGGQSQDPEEIYRVVRAHIDQKSKTGWDTDAFERQKRAVYGQYLRGFDSTEEIANNLFNAVLDGWDFLSYAEVLSEITKEECQSLLSTVFAEDATAMSVVYPMEKSLEGAEPA